MSIVVLPFTNLSDDPEQQYFADGLVDDLTTDLSRIDGMFVISRNSAFTYKGTAVSAKQISGNWVCAMCWREAFGSPAAGSASTLS
jgi:adenylate cyclase